jgi:uncharacterized membrane protein
MEAEGMIAEQEQAGEGESAKAANYLMILYFVLLAAGVLYVAARWHDIPEQYPIHWGPHGVPDNWAARNVVEVFWPIGIATLIGGAIFGLTWALHARPSMKIGMALIAYAGGIPMMAATILLPFRHSDKMPVSVLLTVLIIAPFCSLAAIYFLTKGLLSTAEGAVGDRTPFYTKSGFYKNPNDPALWVPKLNGLGWTINIGLRTGRAIMWVAVAILVAVFGGLLLLALSIARH